MSENIDATVVSEQEETEEVEELLPWPYTDDSVQDDVEETEES